MNRYSAVVILCKDRQHEVFMRTFLVGCGIERGRIRVNPYPIAKGSAEQFVRKKYPSEVKAYREKRNYLKISLTVMVDADNKRVSDRLNELEVSLTGAGMNRRQPDEKIGIFVPKRNIETWLHYLQGERVDEDTVYSKMNRQRECKPLVKQLAQDRNQPLKPLAPPSLQAACTELVRII